MSTFRFMAFALLTFCVQASSAQTLTKRCNKSELSEQANADMALAYLKKDRQDLTSACVVKAIATIDKNMSPQAIPTLIKYLDFKDPMHGPIYDPYTQGPTAGLYPAVDLLARFEHFAVPALEDAVKDEDLSKTARLNAEKALFFLDKTPQMLRFFVKTAQASQHPDVAAALTGFAKEAARGCIPEEIQQCSDAVNSQ
jgi:hypothetical protein